MPASKFEFEQRFWIIGVIFGLGFYLYAIDHTNVAVALLHAVAPSVDPNSAEGNNRLRVIFALGAGLVFVAAFLRNLFRGARRRWALSIRQKPVVSRESTAGGGRRIHDQSPGMDRPRHGCSSTVSFFAKKRASSKVRATPTARI